MPVFNNILAGASGATSGAAAGYQIDRSLRFNSGDAAHLQKVPSSTGNRKTWTWSCWFKRSRLSLEGFLLYSDVNGGNYRDAIRLESSDKLRLYLNGGVGASFLTDQVFRDPSSWYHLVIAVDTTQATASDRVKFYINGSQITSFSSATYPTQNYETGTFVSGKTARIGRDYSGNYFNGYLTDVHFVDGQALAASDFGEYDANNVWQPKAYTHTVPTGDNTGTISVTAAGWGTLNNTVDADDTTKGSSSNNVAGTITFGTALVEVTKVRAKTRFLGGGTAKLYNGSTEVHSVDHSADGTKYYTIYDGPPITITKYEQQMSYQGTPISDDFYALEINGTIVATNTNGGNLSSTIPAAGANNFHLDFSDNTSTTTIAEDSSGNNNDWTANNISVASGSGNDSLIDTPTDYTASSGNNGGNYCTWNPLDNGGVDLSNGNLDVSNGAAHEAVRSTIKLPTSGKYYAEFTQLTFGGTTIIAFGIDYSNATTPPNWSAADKIYLGINATTKYIRRSGTALQTLSGSPAASGNVIQVAYDADNEKLWLGLDNTWYDSSGGTTGNPSTGANATESSLAPGFFLCNVYDATGSVNFGQRPFAYTPPTGYVSLCTQNLPDPTIADGSTAFDASIWSGNSTQDRKISTAFSPDLVWVKRRSGAKDHILIDKLRGDDNYLHSNLTSQNQVLANLLGLVSDGYELGTQQSVNQSGSTYVGWSWDAGSSTVSNTDGSLTSSVRANASSGCSIVSVTTSSSGGSIGHGLNASPGMLILKNRDSAGTIWAVWHSSLGTNDYLVLNSTAAKATDATLFNGTSNSTFTTGGGFGSANYICYSFAPVEGYSAFGSYTGNSSSDGAFIYTGFRPAFVLIKTTNTASSWYVYDSERETYNAADTALFPNLSNAESTNTAAAVDFVSNGFKLRGNAGATNSSSNTYIYAAFAEHPFKTARAR